MKKREFIIIGIIAFTIALSPEFFAPVALGSSSIDTTFEICISVEEIVNLWGLDLKLYYNTQSLDLIKATPQPPWELVNIVKNEISESKGVYRLAMVAFAPESPFTGSTILARLTFLRTNDGESDFQLAETNMVDRNGNPILHTTDGCVIHGVRAHDIAVTKIWGYPRGAYQGDPIYFDVWVENQGDFVETFTVTVYADLDKTVFADEFIVGTQQVCDMPARTSQILNFIWDTKDAPYGKYWISAEASVVLDEIDTQDNFLKAGEYIGGIYPPPAVRSRADFLTQMISVFTVALLTIGGTVKIKKYWCI